MNNYTLTNDIFLEFYTVSSDNKILKDSKFELCSIDGNHSGVFLTLSERGSYRIALNKNFSPSTYQNITDKLIPNVVKQELSNINTIEDIEALRNFGDFFTIYTRNQNHIVSFQLPVVTKQVSTEPGYKSINNIVNSAYVTIYFSKNSSNEITSRNFYLTLYNYESLFSTKDSYSINSIEDLSNIQFQTISNACLNTDNGMIITNYNLCTDSDEFASYEFDTIPYFTLTKGQVNFTITNTVNGVLKYDASVSKDLTYIIKVKNIGNATSSNNTVTTYVPDNITVIETSIKNGTYNKTNRTITWIIDKIEALEELQFEYKATAPKQINSEGLIGKSTIQSNQSSLIQSSNTVVVMNKTLTFIQNPYTGNYGLYIPGIDRFIPMYIIAIILIVITTIFVHIKKKRKSIKSMF